MSELVLVKLVRGPGRETTGTPLRMSRRMAETMVEDGMAEYVAEPETAMAEPPENAMQPRARARRTESR